MAPAPGQLIGGKYRLARALASGGMGSVWVARHEELEIDVALKLIGEADPSRDARARFRREAKTAAQLTSPHVVRIFDYGSEGESPYIAMELLAGEDLRRRLEKNGSLTLAQAAAVVAQLAKALDEAHAADLIHRDIKPRNIFLARAGRDEIVKLLDFGIAKDLTAREETHTGVMLGSPHYMSPEQARGARVDARSDIWSLAVVTFEMLCLDKPFPGTALGDVIAKICCEPPRAIADLAPELPAALDRALARALRRDPTERFDSAGAFAEELARIAREHPTAHAPRRAVDAWTHESATAEASFARAGTTLGEGAPEAASEITGTLTNLTSAVTTHRRARFAGAAALVATLIAGGWYLARVGDTAPRAHQPPIAAPADAPPPSPSLEAPVEAPETAAVAEASSRAPLVTEPSASPSVAPVPRRPRLPRRPRPAAPEVKRDEMFGVPIGVDEKR